MANRKILSTDFVNLKAKVKAEMLRRNKRGSVSSYGSTTYDYSTAPTATGQIKGEHLSKIVTPMKAVNPSGIPAYPGGLTATQMSTMEAKINSWKTRSPYDRSGSDCQSACTGMCYGGCDGSCYSCGGCDGGCYGCGGCDYGCSGCDGCTGSCEGCRGCTSCSGCSGSCSGTCSGGCKGGCNGCTGSCAVGCTGGCSNACINGCTGTCTTNCGGCEGVCTVANDR